MKYFQLEELISEATYKRMGDEVITVFNPHALLSLDNLREFFGVPITINNWHIGGKFNWRGYRDAGYKYFNSRSEHAKGNAFDLDVAGMTAEQARQKIIANKDDPLLIGIQRMENKVNWVHFDLRPVANRIRLFNPY